MPGFRDNSGSVAGWLLWQGDPNDQAAHQAILSRLRAAVTPGGFHGSASISNRVKGNLGEFVAYHIGNDYVFANVMIVDSANAWDPLSDISRPDIDIVWLYFGKTQAQDWAALQEVKTTGGASLSVADSLVVDYEKLFGENVRLTLQTRLGALKNKLDQRGHGYLSHRVNSLAAPAANLAHGIRLVPTLVHDSAYDSSAKMATVRQALIGSGWSSTAVTCWSVSMRDLDKRLSRLARGQP